MPLRILVVSGARPNFVKVAPLLEQLEARAPGVSTLHVHTGQHYDDALSKVFFEQLRIPRPDMHLNVGSASHAKQTGEIMMRMEPILIDWKPDAMVVVGDVNSTMACALVAAKLQVPVAHVEAGLRSFDRTMPEELNRILTDAISEFLFVTEPAGVANLQREGVAAEKIHLVGNVMIDSLRKFLPAARQSSALRDLGLLAGAAARPFALVTLHRPSNVDAPDQLGPLLGMLNQIGEDLPVIFPAHPRTQERFRQFGFGDRIRSSAGADGRGLRIINPLGYLEFLHLQSEAALVLTDSGGVQEEATALGVPCLTLRDNTERPFTVECGTNQVVGRDPSNILRAAKSVLAGARKPGRIPELWDGRTAERIVSILVAGLERRAR